MKRYGKCNNVGACSKAGKNPPIIQCIDDDAEFKCIECEEPLTLVENATTHHTGGDNKSTKQAITILIIVAIIGAIGGGGYYYYTQIMNNPLALFMNDSSGSFIDKLFNGTMDGSKESASETTINSISFDDPDPMLWMDTSDTLKVITDPADAEATYIWKSSNDAVVKVDPNGVITGVGEGEATITVALKEDESISASTKFYVEQGEMSADVKTMRFMEQEEDMVITPGSEKQLNIDCTPGNANEKVFFESGNPNVATVNSFGRVTAVAPGTTLISATTDRTHTQASIKVRVKSGPSATPRKIDLGFAIYEGEIKNGKPEGNGTMTFKRRSVVPGSKGEVVAQPGEYAQGTWRNGEVNLVTLYKKDGNRPIITHK